MDVVSSANCVDVLYINRLIVIMSSSFSELFKSCHNINYEPLGILFMWEMELKARIQPKHTSICGLCQRCYPWAIVGFGQPRCFGCCVVM